MGRMTLNFKPPDTPSTTYVLMGNSTSVGRIYSLVMFLSVVLKGLSFGLNEIISPFSHYQPQTKFTKVMFLQVSVCLWEGGTEKEEVEGIWPRPTPKGEIEGDLVQTHTQGGN